MKLLRTSVSEAGPDELRVEIAIADNADIGAATEHVSLVARIAPPKGVRLLEELQLLALRRIAETIARHIDELRPKVTSARERL